MNKLKKIFGVGPFGAIISLAILAFLGLVDQLLGHPILTTNVMLLRIAGGLLILLGFCLHIWTFLVLRDWWINNNICKTGPFNYVRHPMYSAWIILIVTGLSLCLNSWILLLWPLLIHPIWHMIVVKEEKIMEKTFGIEYQTYVKATGRFIPRLFIQ